MELIDKSTLVAEIKNLRNTYKNCKVLNSYTEGLRDGRLFGYKDVLNKINSLEVKEVDLEKVLESWRHNHFHGRRDKEASGEYLERVSQLDLAKYFFEFGLSSQLSWKDIERIAEIGMDFMNSEDSDNLNDEEYYTEILNRFKAQKGE